MSEKIFTKSLQWKLLARRNFPNILIKVKFVSNCCTNRDLTFSTFFFLTFDQQQNWNSSYQTFRRLSRCQTLLTWQRKAPQKAPKTFKRLARDCLVKRLSEFSFPCGESYILIDLIFLAALAAWHCYSQGVFQIMKNSEAVINFTSNFW